MSVQAQKGNKILRISEDAVERYLSMGYSIIGDDGAVVKQGVPVDNNQLKLAYNQNMREIESLKAEIISLKEQIALLKQENSRLTGESDKAFAPATDTVDAEPKKTRKRKSQNTDTETETE